MIGSCMKKLKIVFFIAALFLITGVKAQKENFNKSIPPFKIACTDSVYFKASDLQKNIPSVLVYFDPDCDHCRDFTESFLKRISEFGNTQIVMISYVSLAAMKKFELAFNLKRYPKIKVGTEGTSFVVQRYYKIQRFPFIAVFNKNGSLQAAYREVPSIDEILKQIK